MVGAMFLAHQNPPMCPKCGSKEVYYQYDGFSKTQKLMCGDCCNKWEVKIDRKLRYR